MNNLKDFMDHYGPSLAERIDSELKVLSPPQPSFTWPSALWPRGDGMPNGW